MARRSPRKGERWRVVMEGEVVEVDANGFTLSGPVGVLTSRAWIDHYNILVVDRQRVVTSEAATDD
jgi:hypothetical protein